MSDSLPPVFDPRALADLDDEDIDGTLVTDVVALYLSDGSELVAAMRNGWRERDVDAVRIAAHTIKSSSGYVGARAVMHWATTIEVRARLERALCPEADVLVLESAYSAACEALTTYLHDRRSREGLSRHSD